MNFSASRIASFLVLGAAALAVAGCTNVPASSQSQHGNDHVTISQTQTVNDVSEEYPMTAAWLNYGSIITFVTWGSSSCPPVVKQVTASSKNEILIELDNPDAQRFCTMDYSPQVNWAATPEGVNPKQVTTLKVLLEDGKTERTVQLVATDQ